MRKELLRVKKKQSEMSCSMCHHMFGPAGYNWCTECKEMLCDSCAWHEHQLGHLVVTSDQLKALNERLNSGPGNTETEPKIAVKPKIETEPKADAAPTVPKEQGYETITHADTEATPLDALFCLETAQKCDSERLNSQHRFSSRIMMSKSKEDPKKFGETDSKTMSKGQEQEILPQPSVEVVENKYSNVPLSSRMFSHNKVVMTKMKTHEEAKPTELEIPQQPVTEESGRPSQSEEMQRQGRGEESGRPSRTDEMQRQDQGEDTQKQIYPLYNPGERQVSLYDSMPRERRQDETSQNADENHKIESLNAFVWSYVYVPMPNFNVTLGTIRDLWAAFDTDSKTNFQKQQRQIQNLDKEFSVAFLDLLDRRNTQLAALMDAYKTRETRLKSIDEIYQKIQKKKTKNQSIDDLARMFYASIQFPQDVVRVSTSKDGLSFFESNEISDILSDNPKIPGMINKYVCAYKTGLVVSGDRHMIFLNLKGMVLKRVASENFTKVVAKGEDLYCLSNTGLYKYRDSFETIYVGEVEDFLVDDFVHVFTKNTQRTLIDQKWVDTPFVGRVYCSGSDILAINRGEVYRLGGTGREIPEPIKRTIRNNEGTPLDLFYVAPDGRVFVKYRWREIVPFVMKGVISMTSTFDGRLVCLTDNGLFY